MLTRSLWHLFWGHVYLITQVINSQVGFEIHIWNYIRCGSNFRCILLKPVIQNSSLGTHCQGWMPENFTDDKSTLVQVMAWCHQAPSHYLSQYWPRSMLPYGITRPQWVNMIHMLPLLLYHCSVGNSSNSGKNLATLSWLRLWTTLVTQYFVYIESIPIYMYTNPSHECKSSESGCIFSEYGCIFFR